MKPVQPIIPGHNLPVTNYAETQDEYQTLPAYREDDGTVLTRWRLTWRERLRVLLTGDVYLFMLTFNQPLQPVMLQVEAPQIHEPKREAMNSEQRISTTPRQRP